MHNKYYADHLHSVDDQLFSVMANLKEIANRFRDLRGKEIEFVKEALNENSEVAVQMVAEQLAKGIKSDGTAAVFTYSPFTIAQKKNRPGLSGVTDHLTNYDTGESYRGLYFKVNGASVEYGTTTDKEADISDRMDGLAFAPTPKNKEELILHFVSKTANRKIRNFLKL